MATPAYGYSQLGQRAYAPPAPERAGLASPPAYNGAPMPIATYVQQPDGTVVYSPEYLQVVQQQCPQYAPAEYAVPVVRSMGEYEQYQKAVPDAQLAASTVEMQRFTADRETMERVGLSAEAIQENLDIIGQKHNIPMGLVQKLMGLTEHDYSEYIVDDSGSMDLESGTGIGTRWEEVRDTMKSMIEVMAYVPTPPMVIRFLNRQEKVTITHERGEHPRRFIERAHGEIDRLFRTLPGGGTPIRECIQRSLKEGEGKRVDRHIFTDGQPNGGSADERLIQTLLKDRADPRSNPVTLHSCSNDPKQVGWLKVVEEVAPFCAECDNFPCEAREVAYDQGDVLPYTNGFHLICQLVGAKNPDDLDAMDESVPFTKFTLDRLLGVVGTEADYLRYFEAFVRAQEGREAGSSVDLVKKMPNWRAHYHEFLHAASHAGELETVKAFKRKLAGIASDS